MNIKVGTRGSTLARTQSQWLIDVLAKAHPQINFEMVIIKQKAIWFRINRLIKSVIRDCLPRS